MVFIRNYGFDPEKHHRKSVRLKGHDYASPGAYFITICTSGRDCIFGKIINGEMVQNNLGEIVSNEWRKTEQIRAYVESADFVVMPNHIHGIIIIHQRDESIERTSPHGTVGAYGNTPDSFDNKGSHDDNDSGDNNVSHDDNDSHGMKRAYFHTPLPPNADNAAGLKSPSFGLGAIVRGYKSACTARINSLRRTPGEEVWQRSFHDHLIKDQDSFDKIRAYIKNNPALWAADKFYLR